MSLRYQNDWDQKIFGSSSTIIKVQFSILNKFDKYFAGYAFEYKGGFYLKLSIY